MARPTVRTAVVTRETVELLREIFGTAANAFKNLRVSDEVTFAVFTRAWKGGAVTPQVVRAIERGWVRWSRRLVKKVDAGEGPTEGAQQGSVDT